MSQHMKWSDVRPWKPGDFFLGRAGDEDVGYRTETHALWVGPNGAGKTTCGLVQNALRAESNVFAIDLKGDIVNVVWEARQNKGQRVAVLDPFGVAKVPDDLRVTWNPLAGISPLSSRLMEELTPLARALVVKFNPVHGFWDEGTERVLVGLMAQTLDTFLDDANLGLVRGALVRPDFMQKVVDRMANNPGVGGLAASAAALLRTGSKEAGYYLGGAQTNTAWLDSGTMRAAMSGGGFQMSDLRRTKTDLYVVLPMSELENHRRWLRLVVNGAQRAMIYRDA